MHTGTMLKQSGRTVMLLSLLLVALLVLAGCGPRAGAAAAAPAAESAVVVSLPALVLDVQPDGSITVGGQSLAQVGAMIGQDFSTFTLPADQVQLLTLSNIQHIQIANSPDGLLILVNGQPMPSLAWDGEKLVATAEVLQSLGGGIALLDKLLPLIQNLGIGVTIRFPVAEGAELIPLEVTDSETAQRALELQQEFLNAVGAPPTFQVTINYAADGTWTMGDLTQSDISQVAGMPMNALNLPPNLIQTASAAGIDTISLYTNPDGIFIAINDRTLPYITWAEGRVNNVLALLEQTGLLGADPNMQVAIETVESLLPAVQASDVRLNINFP
ncbi:MAG TPA: hypothetical protein VNK95_13335 [Caldilineaceae bacterium]|nr:hypothetical protein [Caldilineaceae bacterium]